MSEAVRFIRKNGKIIPIAAAVGGSGRAVKAGKAVARAGVAAVGAHHIAKHGTVKSKNSKIKVNRALDIGGLGLSIASGVLAAATFSGGAKGFIAGHALAHGIDAAGIAANIGSVAGKGNGKERAKQATKQEARNFAVGNAVYAAGVLGIAKNRQALLGYASKILQFGRKALRVT